MPWWLPLAIVGGAKATSQAIQNKRDRKERKRAEQRNESRQTNYYTDLVRNSQRAGFNPLTVLRAGGGMGYSNLAGRITQPLLSVNPFSAGIDAAANFWASTYRTPHQKEMDKLNKEALRSDINLSRAQTASLQYQLMQSKASLMTANKMKNTDNVKNFAANNAFENGRSENGLFQNIYSRTGLAYREGKDGKIVVTGADLKPGWTPFVYKDGETGLMPGEELEFLPVLAFEFMHNLDKKLDFDGDRKFAYFDKFKKSKQTWDLSKIHGILSDNPFQNKGYHNNPHYSGVLY